MGMLQKVSTKFGWEPWDVEMPLSQDNMKMIFSTILDWKLQADNYPGEVSGLSKYLGDLCGN